MSNTVIQRSVVSQSLPLDSLLQTCMWTTSAMKFTIFLFFLFCYFILVVSAVPGYAPVPISLPTAAQIRTRSSPPPFPANTSGTTAT